MTMALGYDPKTSLNTTFPTPRDYSGPGDGSAGLNRSFTTDMMSALPAASEGQGWLTTPPGAAANAARASVNRAFSANPPAPFAPQPTSTPFAAPSYGAGMTQTSTPFSMSAADQAVGDRLAQRGNVDPAVAKRGVPSIPDTVDMVQGRKAIPAGTGGWARLNYGDNNVIVGNKTDGSKKINNFVGYGAGDANSSGSGTASPFDQIYQHIAGLAGRAAMYSNAGDKMTAHHLARLASTLGTLLSPIASQQYGQGQLQLERQKAFPEIARQLTSLNAPTVQQSAAVIAAGKGENINAPKFIQGPLATGVFDPTNNFAQVGRYGMQFEPLTPMPQPFARQ